MKYVDCGLTREKQGDWGIQSREERKTETRDRDREERGREEREDRKRAREGRKRHQAQRREREKYLHRLLEDGATTPVWYPSTPTPWKLYRRTATGPLERVPARALSPRGPLERVPARALSPRACLIPVTRIVCCDSTKERNKV